jgi:hypothetical protein
MAGLQGLEGFQHVNFEPMKTPDSVGEVHEFFFRTRLCATGVAIDAFELRDGRPAGYQFQVIGNPTEDLLLLLAHLIGKIRRALSVRHIEDGGYGLQIGDHDVVRGRIESDEATDGTLPLLVIDGREITWEELGRMLMTMEGSQFRLQIADQSEEL